MAPSVVLEAGEEMAGSSFDRLAACVCQVPGTAWSLVVRHTMSVFLDVEESFTGGSTSKWWRGTGFA